MSTPRLTLLSWALATSLAACAPAYRVRVEESGFTGIRTTAMEGNVLSSGSFLSAGDVELNVERVDSAVAWTRYWVRLRLLADGPEIHPTEPLTLLLDGDSLELAPDSAAIAQRFDGVRTQQARYRASQETLDRLASSTEGRIRVRIGPWLQERRLYPRNVENVRRFLAAQAAADSAAAEAARLRSRR